MSEEDAFASNSIKRWRLDDGIAHRSGMEPRLVVGNAEQNVRARIRPANQWNKARDAQGKH
jgi:hypothetical protein